MRGPRPALGSTNIQTKRERDELAAAQHTAAQQAAQRAMVSQVNQATMAVAAAQRVAAGRVPPHAGAKGKKGGASPPPRRLQFGAAAQARGVAAAAATGGGGGAGAFRLPPGTAHNNVPGGPGSGVQSGHHLKPRAAPAQRRWYSRRNPNAIQGDRGSYLRPAEVGSLRLTIHSPTAPHSQSPLARAAKLEKQRSKQREIVERREAAEAAEAARRHRHTARVHALEGMTSGAAGSAAADGALEMLRTYSAAEAEDLRLRKLRDDAQSKLRHKRAHEMLALLRKRLRQHPSLARVFKTWDTDNSGTLTIDEMQQALGMLNVTVEEAPMRALFSLFDDDGSGEIEAKEFIDAIRHGDTFLAEHKKGQAAHDEAHYQQELAAHAARLSYEATHVPGHRHHKKGHHGAGAGGGNGTGRADDEVDANRLTHAMRYLRDRFRHSKRSAVIKLLQQYDTDGDGCIDSQELQHVFMMMNIPLTPAETTILIETQFDKDGDGAVDYGEFIDRLKESNDADWEKLFDVFETEFKRQKLRAQEERRREEELMRQAQHRHGTGFKLKTQRDRPEMSPALRNVVLGNMGSILHGFERFDVDGDGVLSRDEFGTMLKHFARRRDELKLTKQDVDMIFHYFDKDGDGELEMKEIAATMYHLGEDARASGASDHHGSHAMHAALEANCFHDLPGNDEAVREQRRKDREIEELAAKKSYRRFGSDTRVSIFDANKPPGGDILPQAHGTLSPFVQNGVAGAGGQQVGTHDAIKNYKARQQFLRQWEPSPAQMESIRLAVQFSAENAE